MDILVLGGTGTMGVALTSLLENEGHNVFVTSRNNHRNKELVTYIKGNAKDLSFLMISFFSLILASLNACCGFLIGL